MKMIHQESSVKVYYSKNYSLFRVILGNRPLSQSKIRRITNDILAGTDILKYAPILVYEKNDLLHVVDGQHRFWVCKNLKSWVWYIIVPEMPVHEIAQINSNSENWRWRNYINSYVTQDNEHYAKLRYWNEKLKLSINASFRLLGTGRIGSDGGLNEKEKEVFKKGKFVVANEKEANEFLELMELFKKFPLYKSNKFMWGVDRMVYTENIDPKALAEVFNQNRIGDYQKKGTGMEYFKYLMDMYEKRQKDAA